MTPSFLLRLAEEGSSRQSKAVRERINKPLIPEDIKAFKQADNEELIGWHYAFADFISNPLTLSCSFVSIIFLVSLYADPSSSVQLGDLAAETNARIHDLSGRLTVAQAKADTNEVRVWDASQELEVAWVIAEEKEKEVQQAIRAKLEA